MCNLAGPEVRDAVGAGIRNVADRFESLAFTRAWMERRYCWYPGWMKVDRVQAVLAALRKFSLDQVETALHVVEPLIGLFPGDNLAPKAQEEFVRLDTEWLGQFLYVLYGHTHAAEQAPIERLPMPGSGMDRRTRVYLKMGTWRPRYRQTRTRKGFMAWKNLSFTLIYHPEEDPEEPRGQARGIPASRRGPAACSKPRKGAEEFRALWGVNAR